MWPKMPLFPTVKRQLSVAEYMICKIRPLFGNLGTLGWVLSPL